ncbi:MAG: FABP family protein [Bifidobacteriaceae bacterium]|nr:FABP family protein [Bifidobacteriaceae bacterium]
MVFTIPESLSKKLYPVSWLLGAWQGKGVLAEDSKDYKEFDIAMDFSDNKQNLKYNAKIIYQTKTFLSEKGFLEVLGSLDNRDILPDELKTDKTTPFWKLTWKLNNSHNYKTNYLGWVSNGRMEFNSESILNSNKLTDVLASKRMIGYIKGDLYYAWDLATKPKIQTTDKTKLKSYISAVLNKKD